MFLTFLYRLNSLFGHFNSKYLPSRFMFSAQGATFSLDPFYFSVSPIKHDELKTQVLNLLCLLYSIGSSRSVIVLGFKFSDITGSLADVRNEMKFNCEEIE